MTRRPPRRLIHIAAFIAACIIAALTAEPASGTTIDVTRKGYWQLEIGGAVQPANFSAYHTALEAAVNAWLACGCPVRILQPAAVVGGTLTPALAPDPEPTGTPAAAAITPDGVLFSYTCGTSYTAVDGRPLLGETLAPTTVCLQVNPATRVTQIDWELPGAGHHIERSAPYTWQLDLATVPAGPVTLYLHATTPDGVLQTGVQIPFARAEPAAAPPPTAATVTLEWQRPTSRENGDPLPPEQLWGYLVRVQGGGHDPAPIGVPGGIVTTWSHTLDPGTYTFDVAAVDTDGLTSAYSAPVTTTLD